MTGGAPVVTALLGRQAHFSYAGTEFVTAGQIFVVPPAAGAGYDIFCISGFQNIFVFALRDGAGGYFAGDHFFIPGPVGGLAQHIFKNRLIGGGRQPAAVPDVQSNGSVAGHGDNFSGAIFFQQFQLGAAGGQSDPGAAGGIGRFRMDIGNVKVFARPGSLMIQSVAIQKIIQFIGVDEPGAGFLLLVLIAAVAGDKIVVGRKSFYGGKLHLIGSVFQLSGGQ